MIFDSHETGRDTRLSFELQLLCRSCYYLSVNFCSSILIIWSLKFAMNRGFKWQHALTLSHFCFSWFGLEVLSRVGAFEPKHIPFRDHIKLSLTQSLGVVLNNSSLKYNAVGVFQLIKVMITPLTI